MRCPAGSGSATVSMCALAGVRKVRWEVVSVINRGAAASDMCWNNWDDGVTGMMNPHINFDRTHLGFTTSRPRR